MEIGRSTGEVYSDSLASNETTGEATIGGPLWSGFLHAPRAVDRRSLGWLPGVIGTALVDSCGTSQMVVGPSVERPCRGASLEGWSGSGVRSARGSQAG